ncbi:MAG: DUF503 family protein [Myxococcota bacterium]
MLIAAALIELALAEAESLKARRRVANAVKDRLRGRFNLSVAELSDPDDRHSICIGCVMVGVRPDHLRTQLEKVVRYVEALGLAELVGDDIVVVRLDEVEEIESDLGAVRFTLGRRLE